MPTLPNTRTRRKTAYVMLFVWLFAMASGVANACRLESHGHHDHASPLSHPSATVATLGVADDHARGLTHDHGDTGTGPTKESCLKACDEGSQSVLKHSSGSDFADPALAPFVAVAWTDVMHVAPAGSRAHDFRLPERGPPLRVLFSRLAI